MQRGAHPDARRVIAARRQERLRGHGLRPPLDLLVTLLRPFMREAAPVAPEAALRATRCKPSKPSLIIKFAESNLAAILLQENQKCALASKR